MFAAAEPAAGVSRCHHHKQQEIDSYIQVIAHNKTLLTNTVKCVQQLERVMKKIKIDKTKKN